MNEFLSRIDRLLPTPQAKALALIAFTAMTGLAAYTGIGYIQTQAEFAHATATRAAVDATALSGTVEARGTDLANQATAFWGEVALTATALAPKSRK